MKIPRRGLFAALFLPCLSFGQPEDEKSVAKPKALLVGDSISLAYTPLVQQQLKDRIEVTRVSGNCRYSAWGAEHAATWVNGKHWDVIHFNFGLWDLYGWKQDERISVKDYAKNLETIVEALAPAADLLVFATTTPPCAEPEHKIKVQVSPEEAGKYEQAARAVMRKHGVLINDLYAVLDGRMEKHGRGPADVHFKASGNELLAEKVASNLVLATAVAADLRDR